RQARHLLVDFHAAELAVAVEVGGGEGFGEALRAARLHLRAHALTVRGRLAADDVAVLVGVDGVEVDGHARTLATRGLAGTGLRALGHARGAGLFARGLRHIEFSPADATVAVAVHALDANMHGVAAMHGMGTAMAGMALAVDRRGLRRGQAG